MPKPILLIVKGGKYIEAEFKYNVKDESKCLIPKEKGTSFPLNKLSAVGIQKQLHKEVLYSVWLDAPGYLGKEMQEGETQAVHVKKIKASLENILDKAEDIVMELGAPFYVAEVSVKQHESHKHFNPATTIIGPGNDHNRHYHYDIDLQLQAYVKIK